VSLKTIHIIKVTRESRPWHLILVLLGGLLTRLPVQVTQFLEQIGVLSQALHSLPKHHIVADVRISVDQLSAITLHQWESVNRVWKWTRFWWV
jgi:hypothetical protein